MTTNDDMATDGIALLAGRRLDPYHQDMALIPCNQVRVFDRDAMRLLDVRCIAEYGIPGIVLMENAAVGAVEIALSMTEPNGRMAIVCGRGNNGGDGWAMARHLCNQGRAVCVIEVAVPDPESDAGIHRAIALAMEIPVTDNLKDMCSADCIIDAMLGTGLDRDVQDHLLTTIECINACQTPVLAIDIPSGLHADRGTPMPDAVRATTTATMGGWKLGFEQPNASIYTGKIETVDIGAPRILSDKLGRSRNT